MLGTMRGIVWAVTILLTVGIAHAGHSPPKVFLRVHVQTTGEGQSPMEVMNVNVPPDNDKILVRMLPEASESQLIGIEQDASGGVRLHFNHAAQVNLSAVTGQNQGRILVVLIDGNVVYAPVIDTQITNGELDIPHPIPPVIVQLLQDVAKHNVKEANRT
jgi:hypothetical protein